MLNLTIARQRVESFAFESKGKLHFTPSAFCDFIHYDLLTILSEEQLTLFIAAILARNNTIKSGEGVREEMDFCKYRVFKNLNLYQDQYIHIYFYGSTGSNNTMPFLFPEKTAKVLRGELKGEKGKGQSTSESLIRPALLNSKSL